MRSFLDFDMIIIKLDQILLEYQAEYGRPTYQGLKSLGDDDSAAIRRDMHRRKTEIAECLRLGKVVVLFISGPQTCFRATGQKEHSGTGRSRTTTRIVEEFDILSLLPVKVSTVPALGDSIEFRGSDIFSKFVSDTANWMYYEAYFKNPLGNPLLLIKGTDKVVASWLKHSNGHLIFLPSFPDYEEFKSVKEAKTAQRALMQSLTEVVKNLNSSAEGFQLPEWTESYMLSGEDIEIKQLTSLNEDLHNLLMKIDEQKKRLAELRELKILLVGTGTALEVIVKRVFEKLGFEATEGLPGRDDLIMHHNGQPAVVEVKGVSKSGAEKHAAQLEKWVSDFYASRGTEPKGILVVNAYNNTPLTNRIEEPFPSQMLGYSKKRGHCLLTTTQLLGMYFAVMNDPTVAELIIKNIFSTVGAYPDYADWTSFIELDPASTETADVSVEGVETAEPPKTQF